MSSQTQRTFAALNRPLVTKMAGKWLWVCAHGDAVVSDELGPADSRDPWAAVLALAIKHAEQYHSTTAGEEVR